MTKMRWNHAKRPGLVVPGGRPGFTYNMKLNAHRRQFAGMTDEQVERYRVHASIASRNAAMRGKVSLTKLPWEEKE